MAPLPVTGTYTILLSDDGFNETGDYTLVLERELPTRFVPWLPYNSTTQVAIDHAVDVDWLHVYAEAGSSVSLAVSSPNGVDPLVEVFDPDGAPFASDTCVQGCSLLIPLTSLTRTGTYTVRFSDDGLNEAGNLQVTLNCIFHPLGICPDPMADAIVGTSVCSTLANSTGMPAEISGFGSPIVADDRLWLRAVNVPAGQFGLFYFGTGSASQSFPSPNQGTLCVGGNLVRAPVLQTCSDGTAEYRLPLDSGVGGAVFSPGNTWRFQLWFRDVNPTVTSNTTDATSVLLQ